MGSNSGRHFLLRKDSRIRMLCCITRGTFISSSAQNRLSTNDATSPCVGRPIPNRNRRKWSEPIWVMVDFSPLCPASPPPACSLTVPKESSISSCITRISSEPMLKYREASPILRPLSFMKVIGFSKIIGRLEIMHLHQTPWNFSCHDRGVPRWSESASPNIQP